jgi:hypothetical protein
MQAPRLSFSYSFGENNSFDKYKDQEENIPHPLIKSFMSKKYCFIGVHRPSRRFAMFKPLTPCHATVASCDNKAPAGTCASHPSAPSLLRAQFSAELTKLLAQMVTLR